MKPAQRVIGLMLIPMLLSATSALAAGRMISIEEFEADRERWVDQEIIVEGRWAVLGRDQFRFKKSPITFRSSAPLPVLTRKTSNLRATGKLVRENGRLSFRATSVSEDLSDMDEFARRRRELPREEAEPLYRLAAWAKQRGTFYDDGELLQAAEQANLIAFGYERRALGRDDVEGRLALAEKAERLQLPELTWRELTHEALWLRKEATAVQMPPDWKKLAEEIATRLPGTATVPTTDLKATRDAYLANPLAVYRAATAAEREPLHRIFWADIALAEIRARAASLSENGFETAASIDVLLPEFHGVAEQYRNQALAERAEQVAKLARADVLALREQFRERDQAEAGQQMLESWLTLQRKKLEADDMLGLARVADDYARELNRPDMAARLLMDASVLHPDSEDLAAGLQKLGYHRHLGRWMKAADIEALPDDPLQRALREGRVEVGMTAAQVRKSLGEPTTFNRILSSRETNEIWRYGQIGATGLKVYLVQSLGQPEAKVIAVDQLPVRNPAATTP